MSQSITARELAARFGLHRAGREWRGTCPCCGYLDAFVLTERQGRTLAWCASCQNRDGIVQLLRGAGTLPAHPAADAPAHNHEAATARRTARALAIWNGAELATETSADWYLSKRKLPGLAASAALRFRADTPHPAGGRLPALIALIQDVRGNPLAVHRTFLRRDGSDKAEAEPQKATLGPFSGGAIRLDPIAPRLAIGEGIESSASAGRLLGLPAWAAIAAGNLARSLALPTQVKAVVIAADADPAGERAAREAAWRWQREGRRVQLAHLDKTGADFNDLIQEAARA